MSLKAELEAFRADFMTFARQGRRVAGIGRKYSGITLEARLYAKKNILHRARVASYFGPVRIQVLARPAGAHDRADLLGATTLAD